MSNKNVAIILASGTGNRFNSDTPKQYEKINNKEIFYYSLKSFLDHNLIHMILPVINFEHQDLYNSLLNDNDLSKHPKLFSPIFGGKERYDSVKNALNFLKTININIHKVLIHDSARPFIREILITNILSEVKTGIGIIPVLTIPDSVKKIVNGKVINTLKRDNLFRIQTPQGFLFTELINAYDKSKNIETDDSEVFRKAGFDIHSIEGDYITNKITTKQDKNMLEKLYLNTKFIIGQGFDVHKIVNGKELFLGGVKIDCNFGLLGHSDADVVIHALVDAILGALGKGDIGTHFPNTDIKWKGVKSKIFLEYCGKLITDNNYYISNIDITIICEKPKISPYFNAIRECIAKILQINKNYINIKGSTTEGLGFTGRKEGIASLAVISLYSNFSNI